MKYVVSASTSGGRYVRLSPSGRALVGHLIEHADLFDRAEAERVAVAMANARGLGGKPGIVHEAGPLLRAAIKRAQANLRMLKKRLEAAEQP